jgi:transcriptional regulator with XRE-family HTH domain
MVNAHGVDAYAFTLGDRMKRSAKVAGLSRYALAEYLDVTPETVSTWTNDRIKPSTQTLRLWALKTGAPYAWLVSGEWTPRDLNPEPTGYGSAVRPTRLVSLRIAA